MLDVRGMTEWGRSRTSVSRMPPLPKPSRKWQGPGSGLSSAGLRLLTWEAPFGGVGGIM